MCVCVCVCVLSPLYSSCCLFSATRTAHLDTHTPHLILSFLPPTTLFSAQCPNDCSGHGLCGKEGATKGRCMCVAGWVSVDCSKHSNAVLRRKSEACAHTCSPAHGTCKMGRCACEPGWAGKRCDQAICPNMCTAVGNGKFRGVCANGKVRDVRLYACSTLWWLRWSIIISGAIAHFLPPSHTPPRLSVSTSARATSVLLVTTAATSARIDAHRTGSALRRCCGHRAATPSRIGVSASRAGQPWIAPRPQRR